MWAGKDAINRVSTKRLTIMYRYTYYTKWFKEAENLKKDFDKLFDIFRNLLLQTNGDVN